MISLSDRTKCFTTIMAMAIGDAVWIEHKGAEIEIGCADVARPGQRPIKHWYVCNMTVFDQPHRDIYSRNVSDLLDEISNRKMRSNHD